MLIWWRKQSVKLKQEKLWLLMPKKDKNR